jgi:hypothetical protein
VIAVDDFSASAMFISCKISAADIVSVILIPRLYALFFMLVKLASLNAVADARAALM